MTRQSENPDRSAQFVSLLAGTERQLSGFILSLLPNFADAEEVLQETKLRLWEQFDDYDPEKSFDGWARSIAYFQILTHRKKASRGQVVFSTELMATLSAEFGDREKELGFRTQALQDCLEQLTTRVRTMLDKYYSGSSSIDALAKSFGLTASAVRKALYRTRVSLHECISRRLGMAERKPSR